MNKNKKTITDIAYLIAADIIAYGLKKLPPVSQLALRYATSQQTVIKALKDLKQRGAIEHTRRKSGTAVVQYAKDSEGKLPVSQGPAIHGLYEKILEDISNGTIRAGEPMPKVDSFVLEHNVSQHTVVSALKRLREENIIRKRGNRWIVGRYDRSTPGSKNASPIRKDPKSPVIVFLWPGMESWKRHWSYFDPVFFPFSLNLTGELSKFGYTFVRGVYTQSTPDIQSHGQVAPAVETHIRSLGDRYAGAFLLTYIDCRGWIEWLCRFEKPVIGFFPSAEYRIRLPHEKKYAFCQYATPEDAHCAIDILAEYGHRSIGIVLPRGQEYDWAVKRTMAMKRHARGKYPQIQIDIIYQRESFWLAKEESNNPETFPAYLRALAKECREKNVGYLDALRLLSPSLASIVDKKKNTAIVAMNDELARGYGAWLHEAGIDYPRDISLIGFDNDMSSRFSDISTIDFGFHSAAYSAAHFFIGDIPVKKERDGRIRDECRFIDRGSIKKISW